MFVMLKIHDEIVGEMFMCVDSLTVIWVADADTLQTVKQPEVEPASQWTRLTSEWTAMLISLCEWTRLISSEESRTVNKWPVIPRHRLVITQRPVVVVVVQRRLQRRLTHLQRTAATCTRPFKPRPGRDIRTSWGGLETETTCLALQNVSGPLHSVRVSRRLCDRSSAAIYPWSYTPYSSIYSTRA